jgi:hypothetical protein
MTFEDKPPLGNMLDLIYIGLLPQDQDVSEWGRVFKLSVGVARHAEIVEIEVFSLKDRDPVGLPASRSVEFSK